MDCYSAKDNSISSLLLELDPIISGALDPDARLGYRMKRPAHGSNMSHVISSWKCFSVGKSRTHGLMMVSGHLILAMNRYGSLV
jgi:hypothetical protein